MDDSINRPLSLRLKKFGAAFVCMLPFALASAQPEAVGETAPVQELTPEILYQFLLGEIAGARGQLTLSSKLFLKLARETGDPRIARRAAEFSLFDNNLENAGEAAQLWTEFDPQSQEAQRLLLGLSAEKGKDLDSIQAQIARVLAQIPANLPQNLLGINAAFSSVEDKKAINVAVTRLTEPYLDYPEAYLARAQASAIAGELAESLSNTNAALKLRPDWEPALLLKYQLMVDMGVTQQALGELAQLVKRMPQNRILGTAYARTLVSAKEYEKARDEFLRLLKLAPDDADTLFSAALLSFQIEDDDQAEKLFMQALEAEHPAEDLINLHLGQIAERRKDWDEAIRLYREVGPGGQYSDAQIRIAMVMNSSGKLSEALKYLRSLKGDENEKLRYLQTEIYLLREAGQTRQAFDLAESTLRKYPDDENLLYDVAMLAEKVDRIDILETRLKRLIAISPEHAHAYNALGYTYADRNMRLDEAEQLIRKALELMPNDPFILDSLGWLQFRRGNNAAAVETLGQAYEKRADPEIAAHLGEVLWSLGLQDEADQIFGAALQNHPENEMLRETVQRVRGR